MQTGSRHASGGQAGGGYGSRGDGPRSGEHVDGMLSIMCAEDSSLLRGLVGAGVVLLLQLQIRGFEKGMVVNIVTKLAGEVRNAKRLNR